MNDLKNYRNNELKNYVIGNILLILFFSGVLEKFYSQDMSQNLNIWGTLVESAIVSSVLYIYVFLFDSLLPGNIKEKIVFFPIGKLPGYTIFSDMQNKLKDNRFTQSDITVKYAQVYQNMPTDKKQKEKYENAQWYKIYQKYKNESKILTSNRDYLLCRDIVIITITLGILYAISCRLGIISFSIKMMMILIIEIIISDVAMRGKAKRLAYNVISEDVYK